jgi:hypothetical protein
MPSGPDPHEAAELLLKALDGLTADERDLVLQCLLTGSLGPSFVARAASVGREIGSRAMEAHLGQRAVSQANQPLVIRLPSDLHARFRKWSTNNGFTMAAVARGLIERFLEGRV